eukprot:Seg11976.2 transcript_id=Seg11976.2/GoldUCD/mRNA.D3Y31 product="hypothetical protein" protein_id=Seg11976.2/GoldUCD/D3Y31
MGEEVDESHTVPQLKKQLKDAQEKAADDSSADGAQGDSGASADASQDKGTSSEDDPDSGADPTSDTSAVTGTSPTPPAPPKPSAPVAEKVASYTVQREIVENGKRYKVNESIDLTSSRRAALGKLVK